MDIIQVLVVGTVNLIYIFVGVISVAHLHIMFLLSDFNRLSLILNTTQTFLSGGYSWSTKQPQLCK